MEFLKAEYTEVWVPSSIVPLIKFADKVQSLATTGIELFGINRHSEDPTLLQRLHSFDEIVTWYGTNRIEFREALQHAQVKCVFHNALPDAHGSVHATDFFAAQVGAPPGLTPKLQLENAKSRDSIVMHPFSGSVKKNWPLAQYRELANLLSASVEWLAGPEEPLDAAVRIEDLAEVAKWLKGARCYVGNDSGITHLAAAVGVPTVALFGPTEPRVWQPRGRNVKVLRHQPLRQLSAQVVRDAVLELT